MTERLYYDDSYLTHFSARVVERLDWDGRPAVVLDRSAFYPTGGGQPHDTGTLWDARSLNEVPVVDVVEREPVLPALSSVEGSVAEGTDGAVVHVLARSLEADTVKGQINWERRFDLMQQHTGQHVLSAAFLEAFEAHTVGFHLSDEYSTIDLDRAPIPSDGLTEVEALANAVVFENRHTVARFVPDEEVPNLPLRKPLAHEGPVRIVEIPGFDCSACGGTHVRTAGEVGLIKITRSERRGAETRVEFLCGRRALADYQAKNTLVMDLAREYTVAHWELSDMVHRLAGDLKETRRELRRTRDALLDAEATALWRQAALRGDMRVVKAHFAGRAPDDLKHLAQRLVAQPQTVALLGSGEPGQKGFFTFARSPDLDLHMGNLVRQACQVIDGGGGGRPELAQGGGPQGDRVAEALDVAFQSLEGSLTA